MRRLAMKSGSSAARTAIQSSAPGLANTGAERAPRSAEHGRRLDSSTSEAAISVELGLESERTTAIGTFDQEDGRLPLLDDPMDHEAFGELPRRGLESDQVTQGKRPVHGFSLLVEMVGIAPSLESFLSRSYQRNSILSGPISKNLEPENEPGAEDVPGPWLTITRLWGQVRTHETGACFILTARAASVVIMAVHGRL